MWGRVRKDYTMNGKAFEVMDYLYKVKKASGTNKLRFHSKTYFREIFDITEPTYRKIMSELTARGYIKYIENCNHFVDVDVLV